MNAVVRLLHSSFVPSLIIQITPTTLYYRSISPIITLMLLNIVLLSLLPHSIDFCIQRYSLLQQRGSSIRKVYRVQNNVLKKNIYSNRHWFSHAGKTVMGQCIPMRRQKCQEIEGV